MIQNRLTLISFAGMALGGSVVMTRFGLREIPAFTLIALRLLLATAAFALALAVLRPPLPRGTRTLADIALIGLINTALPLIAFTLALQYLSSGVLTLFIALVPMVTGLMAHVWLAQERLTAAKLGGLAIAFGGVVFLLLTGTNGLSATQSALDIRGPALCLIGVVLGSFAAVYTRRQLRHVHVVSLSAGQTGVAALVLAPLGLILSRPNLGSISGQGWLSVGYTGLIGSFFAFMLIFQLIRQFGATSSAVVTYLMPPVSGLLGALLLNEVVTLPLAVGAIVILLGVYVSERAAPARPAPPVAPAPADDLRRDPCLMC